MTRASMMLRRLVSARAAYGGSSLARENVVLSSVAAASYSTLFLTDDDRHPLFGSQIAPVRATTDLQFGIQRSFYSSRPTGPSNLVVIETEEQFNDSIRKVQDESLPAMLYFTAVWCGPCRMLAPLIEQMCRKYPLLTIYKIDIDNEKLEKPLSLLNVSAVPTMRMFKDGKQAAEVVGADPVVLRKELEKLY